MQVLFCFTLLIDPQIPHALNLSRLQYLLLPLDVTTFFAEATTDGLESRKNQTDNYTIY